MKRVIFLYELFFRLNIIFLGVFLFFLFKRFNLIKIAKNVKIYNYKLILIIILYK